LVLLAMQTGARRAVLMPNADGSVDLGTGSNATDYPSLTMRRLINADGSAAFASLSGAAFTGAIAVYNGAVSTQQPLRRMGWSNGVQRWADVLEADAGLGFYAYDTGGNITGSYNLTPQGQLSSSLGTYWHSGNFGRPQAAAGVGQYVFVNPGLGQGYTLPAGGTWAYFWNFFTSAGAFVGSFVGIAAGGAGVGGTAGQYIQGFSWRVA
jgi:hypothetical protein